MNVNDNKLMSSQTKIEISRAMQEMQGAIMMAKNYPRNYVYAKSRIIETCKDKSFCESALFSYPRGGTTITGPSIRLAEQLANSFGNMKCGVKVLEQTEEKTCIKAYALDLETNSERESVTEVFHYQQLRDGKKKFLTDPRDIDQHVLNFASRRLRQCILALMPKDYIDAAMEQIKITLTSSNTKSLQARIKDIVEAFKPLSVTAPMLQKKLGHSMETLSDDELFELKSIYSSIKNGEAKKEDYFTHDVAFLPEETEKPESLKEKLKGLSKGEIKRNE